ncbi:hypothetical protein [Nostocoides vanveenii]|uniref:Uncharacterized protein n=1 Tax=Nostocoides vanveenii TaxID=330835 RepID=A0ABN2K3P3_9MICO
MSITTHLRSWAAALAAGLLLALGFGALYAWRNPERPTAVALTVMTVMSWPIFTAGLQLLWFDRAGTDAELDKGKDDIERTWLTEAAANAFFGTLGGLIAIDTIGSALQVSWLSTIGLTHVLVVGLGLFALSYGWVRLGNR